MSGKKKVVFRDLNGNKVCSISIDKVKKSLKTAGAGMSLVVIMLISGAMTTGDIQDSQEQQKIFSEAQNNVVSEMEIEEEQAKEAEKVYKDYNAEYQDQLKEEKEKEAEEYIKALQEENEQDEVQSRVGP